MKAIAYKATLTLFLELVLPIAAWFGGYRRPRPKALKAQA